MDLFTDSQVSDALFVNKGNPDDECYYTGLIITSSQKFKHTLYFNFFTYIITYKTLHFLK